MTASSPSGSRTWPIGPAARGKRLLRPRRAHALGNRRVNPQEHPPGLARLEDFAEFIDQAANSGSDRTRAGPARAAARSPATGSVPRIRSECESPAREKRGRFGEAKEARAPAATRLSSGETSASTAAGSSRCSVISSALPLGRIRNPSGEAPWASRIAARRDPL